ncbi:MAG: type II secretion system protein GspD [Vulcanimicrobiaceae bacterium]
MNRLAIRSCAAALTAALSLLSSVAGRAQATALVSVRAELAAGQPAKATLVFDNGVPQYRIYGNGTNEISVVLVGTTRAPNAATSIAGKNSLRSITLEALGDSTSVVFHLSEPTNLNLTTGSGQSLVANLQAAGNAPAPFGAAALASPSPQAAPALASGADMEVVPLKYADVSEVVGLLVSGQQLPSNDSFTPQQQSFGAAGASGFGGFGGLNGLSSPLTTQTLAQSGGAGTAVGQLVNDNIGIDRRLNAIVLTGPPDLIASLKEKIEKIDIPLPSVVLETQIVELTDSAAHDIGIDFTNGNGEVASATYQLQNQNGSTGVLNLQAAVYAQISKGEGTTIARPRIVAQNGSSAQILTGDALPIVTSIAVSGVNAVSQQVQYVNVGVNLQIEPRISSDGYVTSHVFSEVSSVTGYQQGYPTLSQREATTTATVKDGESFVIGGLLQNDELSSLSKVPGIGDIPLIGWLFRVRHDQSKLTNLYIIVTPHILTNGNPVPPGVPTK